jgi:hypothetical protein
MVQRRGDVLPGPIAAVTDPASGSTGYGRERMRYTEVSTDVSIGTY